MKDYEAKFATHGFRGRYWHEGEIADNVTPEEEQTMEIQHYFKPCEDAQFIDLTQSAEQEVEKPQHIVVMQEAAKQPAEQEVETLSQAASKSRTKKVGMLAGN